MIKPSKLRHILWKRMSIGRRWWEYRRISKNEYKCISQDEHTAYYIYIPKKGKQ